MHQGGTRGHCCNAPLQEGAWGNLQENDRVCFDSLQPVIYLPNAFSTDFSLPSPTASPPPAYDNVAYMPKDSSD